MKTSSDTAVSARLATTAANGERGDDVGVILDALRSIVRELRLASREAEQRVGVHGAQLHALRRLSDSPATSLTELAERTHTDISSVSVVISRLVALDLVSRDADPADRRRLTLSLTTQGRAAIRRAPTTPRDRLTDAAAALSHRELQGLVSSLGKLADALDEGSTRN